MTEDGQALARVSVIDFQSGLNVYDHFVKPPRPVLDYRTQLVDIPSAEGLIDETDGQESRRKSSLEQRKHYRRSSMT